MATGIAIDDGRLLMVASRYPSHAQSLWNLPGGRQKPGELLEETVVREVFEETGAHVEVAEVAYVSESYDGATHYSNVAFVLHLVDRSSFDKLKTTGDPGDHVVAVEWVPLDQVGERIVVGVVREPLLAYLRGELPRHYAGFHEAGITIEWPPGLG